MRRTLAVLLLLSVPFTTNAYIKSAIPPGRQIAYLKRLTGDICEFPTGELSDEMIKAVPQVMKGWSKSKRVSAENAVAVENLIKRLVDEGKAGNPSAVPLTTEHYNFMLESWARSGEGVFAAERCEQILTHMQARYEQGDDRVQPNLSSFKVVLLAWRGSGAQFAAYRAQRVLAWMVELYKYDKNDQVLPDSDCFDIVLQSWSQSDYPEAPRNAEKLLVEMEQLAEATKSQRLKPKHFSFNAVLRALARSQDPGSWRRATDVLGFMEKLYYVEGNTRVEPDAVTYGIVLGAMTKSLDPESAPKADEILRFIETQYKSGNLNWKPDSVLFNSVMACWAKSGHTGAYRNARSILDRQLNLYRNGNKHSKPDELGFTSIDRDGNRRCKPDVFGFTSVLSSCASEPGEAEERRKAFNVALSTYRQLVNNPEEFGQANHVTYGTMLKACSRLLPSGQKHKHAKTLFEECKARGLVGDMVLSRLEDACTEQEFKALMDGHSKGNLPKEWSQNVNEKVQYARGRSTNGKRAEV